MTAPSSRGLVLVNPASGPDPGAADDVRRHFADHEVVECDGDELATLVKKAIGRGVDFIAMAGGDGSIRCAASLLAETGVALIPVPTGTRNHFARELGIETIEAAAAAISGERRTVDLAEVNGRRFVNNSSVGFYAALVRERDEHERHLPALLANITAAWAQARKGHRFRVTVNGRSHRAWLVFVGNGCYGEGVTDLIHREALDRALLDVRVLRADVRLARTRSVLALVLGRLAESPMLVQTEECQVAVEMTEPSVEVALDGEVERLRPPLCFRSLPGVLTVLVPASADGKVGA